MNKISTWYKRTFPKWVRFILAGVSWPFIAVAMIALLPVALVVIGCMAIAEKLNEAWNEFE